MHTPIHTDGSQPCKEAVSSLGVVRVRCLFQGHLDTKVGGAEDRTSNLSVTGPPALPPELLPLQTTATWWWLVSSPLHCKESLSVYKSAISIQSIIIIKPPCWISQLPLILQPGGATSTDHLCSSLLVCGDLSLSLPWSLIQSDSSEPLCGASSPLLHQCGGMRHRAMETTWPQT